jgi:hypothetical protein
MKIAFDDPSSSALCVVCAGRFPRGVLAGEGKLFWGGFDIFSGFCYF